MTDEVEDTSHEWLKALEGRLERARQHQKLAHEVGAGSPCSKCGDKCPGLDLHFWRKMCKLCKCAKDEHDIPFQDDGGIRFEILMKDSSKKYKNIKTELEMKVDQTIFKNPAHKHQEKSKQERKTVSFDWLPPHVSEAVVTDYLKQLPVDKIPIKNSDGALYRKQQLERQIPINDISPILGDRLTPEEQKGFYNYLRDIQDNAVGQGMIQRIMLKQFLEESIPCSNLQDPQTSSSLPVQERSQNNEPHNDNVRNLNLPTYNPRQQVRYQRYPRAWPVRFPHSSLSIFRFPVTLRTSPPPNLGHGRNGYRPIGFRFRLPGERLDVDQYPGFNEPELVEGLQRLNPYLSEPNYEQHSQNNASSDSSSGFSSDSSPDDKKADLSMEVSEDNKQEVNSAKQRYEYNYQRGFDSHPENYTPATSQAEDLTSRNNINADNRVQGLAGVYKEVLTVEEPLKCVQCGMQIELNTVAVLTDRAGDSMAWHPQCFVCTVCKELLVDLVYFFKEGKVYCGRHYADMVNIPRCSSCDELIFVAQYTVAEGKSYHVPHFCCVECDKELGGHRYVELNEQPVCLSCYSDNHSKICINCNQKIQAADVSVRLEGLQWHNKAACFKCANCKTSLVGNHFKLYNSEPFCSVACVHAKNTNS